MANTDTDLRCYLTNAGIAAENNAIQLGRKLPIKEMVFGSGVLADGEDPRNQTTMISEQFKVPCAMNTHSDDPTLLTFKGDIPVDVGGFNINEVAIRLEDGTIYGYARGTGDYKPTPEQGATELIRYVVDMYSTNVTVIECKVDLSNVYADYEDLEQVKSEAAEALQGHEKQADPHGQYLKTDILVGFIFPDSTTSATRDIAFIADGSSYLIADYPKLMGKVQGTYLMVSQSSIDENPEQYAACYGLSNDGKRFTVPNYPFAHT
uniref:Phage tail fiber protein n=1 Tax=Vibrio tasmaniensis TaxID=212663 RepID=A0A0H3ZQZ8_9VIBR|nr:Phage tail fiber protein [Vibrio tasmaniensis]